MHMHIQVQECFIGSIGFKVREALLSVHHDDDVSRSSLEKTVKMIQDDTPDSNDEGTEFKTPSFASISKFVVVPSGDESLIMDYVGRVGPVTVRDELMIVTLCVAIVYKYIIGVV